MFDKFSEKNIWVSAKASENGDGSFEKPFSKIQTAVKNAAPGSFIMLFSGIYDEKLVLRDLSASIEEPITISAFIEDGEKEKEEVVSCSEWYLYSVKDFVIKGIVFRKTANAALSLIGECERNSVKDCVFDDCGLVSDCALFLGGSGGNNNVIENCSFNAPKDCKDYIAVMISQSIDVEDKNAVNSRNTSVRFCRFKNCKTAVLIGSDESISSAFGGHELCDCFFENCLTGVKIKISMTLICGNIFRNCKNAIINAFGSESEIFENRFENCENAIFIASDDATIGENCFIDSKILFESNINEESLPILIYENTFAANKDSEVIFSKNSVSAFVSKNVFYNCEVSRKKLNEKDNVFEKNDIFADFLNGDLSTNLDYGCKSGAQKRLEIEEIPQVNIVELFEKQESDKKSDKDLSQKMVEERDLYIKSMYFQDESQEDEEMEFEATPVGYQGLRPIGIDGELEDN
jgi:hypothetical protein